MFIHTSLQPIEGQFVEDMIEPAPILLSDIAVPDIQHWLSGPGPISSKEINEQGSG
jgi:hypothetical protein